MTLLVDTVIATSAILAASLLLAGLCRSASAALRHLILAIGIVAALAVPATRSVVPAWRLPVAGWWSALPLIDQAGTPEVLSASPAAGPATSIPAATREAGES